MKKSLKRKAFALLLSNLPFVLLFSFLFSLVAMGSVVLFAGYLVEEEPEWASMGGSTSGQPSTESSGSADSIGSLPEHLQGEKFFMPMAGQLTSPFGNRSIAGGSKNHRGIDIGIRPRETESHVYPSRSGVVVTAVKFNNPPSSVGSGGGSGYGQHVIVKHNNTGGKETWTMYAHFYRTHVKEGQTVDMSTSLGFAGNTGQSVGAHLHFEIRLGQNLASSSINPATVLECGGKAIVKDMNVTECMNFRK